MEIIRLKDAQGGGKKAFELVKEEVEKDAKVFGLATGSTPETFYKELINSSLDFSDKISINLDEYIGLSGTDDQSYRYFMNEHLFNKKPFKESYVPNGKAEDLEAECRHYDQIISENPIDVQILGIGQNGHIGFNEPGTPFDTSTHVVKLTESTINANKRNFENVNDVPTHALSMGIGSIMKAKKIILLAYGKAKAEAIKGMVEGEITPDLPASVLQNHPDVVVIVDEEAASLC